MKDKLLQLAGGLFQLALEAFKEAGGFGWQFATTLLVKLLKSELWVAAGTIVGALLAPKLGITEDNLVALWSTLATIAVAYIAQRGYSKPRELAANPTSPQASPQ